ncbi:hypothetical protein Tdes44962_MAKER07874 [Teratosphaeria destructans]|uniref:Uncharacterized protein n=1 Tax=Teratosphaeria destructans TaxID=418781 RepID=A0A9W7SY60_9PEZI|nr:hypothetical protein Tdes44962_MAKER07874 [Teratosphaeria destructans]
MKFIAVLPLAVTCLSGIAYGQFIIGALAVMEFVVEVLEAEAVVAEVTASTDIAITAELVEGEALTAETSLALTGSATNEAGSLTLAGVEDLSFTIPQEGIIGELEAFTARAAGGTRVATPCRLHTKALPIPEGVIPPITFESTFTAQVAARNSEGLAATLEPHFTIGGEALEGAKVGVRAGRYTARLKNFTVKMLRGSS